MLTLVILHLIHAGKRLVSRVGGAHQVLQHILGAPGSSSKGRNMIQNHNQSMLSRCNDNCVSGMP